MSKHHPVVFEAFGFENHLTVEEARGLVSRILAAMKCPNWPPCILPAGHDGACSGPVEPPDVLPSPTDALEERCVDCGEKLNAGEAKTFTCCDSCWSRTYGLPLFDAQMKEATSRAEKAERRAEELDAFDSPTGPYVLAFARLMESKLEQNRHKGNREGWIKDDRFALLRRLREEFDELSGALYSNTEKVTDPARVGSEAADVGNFAMMIADVCGALLAAKEPQS